jgi:type II secretory pathway component PulC
MAAKARTQQRASRILMLLCVAAALIVYMAVNNPVTVPRRGSLPSAPAGSSTSVAAIAQFTPPSLATLPETVERPVFTSGRRPFVADAPVAAATPAAIPKGEFALIGVSIRADRRDALLRRNSTGVLAWVTEGDKLETWVVKTVQTDRVILELGGERDELELWTAENKPPPAASLPRTAAPRPATPSTATTAPRPAQPPANVTARPLPPAAQQAVPPNRQARPNPNPNPRTKDR